MPGRDLVQEGAVEGDDQAREAEESRMTADQAAIRAIQASRIRKAEN